MNLQELVGWAEGKVRQEVTDGTAWLEQHLPGLADKAAMFADELVSAAIDARNLSPALRSGLASAIRQADADVVAMQPPPAPEPPPAEADPAAAG